VTDVTLAEIEAAGSGNGVMVGRPVEVATVAIAPLDPTGRPTDEVTNRAGVTGEILIAADHVKDHYDKLWWTERGSRLNGSWHRSGDVGHFDDAGQLWVEGRLRHVITGPDGLVTPVGIEQRVEALDEVFRAAVVGVGPAGVQQVVVVVETEPRSRRQQAASAELAAAVRTAAEVPVAAVFSVPELPTDIRHNAKVKRELVAAWAERKLAGGRGGRWGSLT
jgi:acyl-coenzyme A synthetase/AMP-(fatty) acid ligase